MQHPHDHSPACSASVGAGTASPLCRSLAAVIGCWIVALLCGGCSLSFPIAPMVADKDDMTASIRPIAGQMRDEEDRRRSKSALSTALDPQGNGTAVTWENPTTGNRGAFTPVGHAYPADARICRSFLEALHENGEDKTIQGTACTIAAGEWAVTDAKPSRKS